jgi:glucosyl-3-phosphoglycerate synthase
MGDFHQSGPIATLHRLSARPVESLEADLVEWSKERPMALVIPALYSELEGDALDNIVEELSAVPYLSEIIIGIDRADAEQFEHAKQFFSRLPQRHRLLWNDGPQLRQIDAELEQLGIAPDQPGKGRNVWYCLGYYLASRRASAVALHDADIITYDRSMLARLLYPVTHPTFGYAFAKGYYFRSDGEKLNGRVSRLLVAPLLHALRVTLDHSDDYLEFLQSFRYPLAGEFAMHQNVVRNLRIPSDWGLEIGVMSELYRRYTPQRICQVDIAGAYDHKHQIVSPEDAENGLNKMSIDIAKALFRKVAIDGEILTPETFRTIKASYYRTALDHVDRYRNDAWINGFAFDQHAEEQMVELFAQSVMEAGEKFLNNSMETPFIASWARVQSAMPDVLDRIAGAVEADN